MTIHGTNLTGAKAVRFATKKARSFKVSSATSIAAESPAASAAGAVNVTVSTAGGTSQDNSGDRYTYG